MALFCTLCWLAASGFISLCKAIGKLISKAFHKTKRINYTTQREKHNDLLGFDEFCDIMDEGE